jgi:hypothetical protein
MAAKFSVCDKVFVTIHSTAPETHLLTIHCADSDIEVTVGYPARSTCPLEAAPISQLVSPASGTGLAFDLTRFLQKAFPGHAFLVISDGEVVDTLRLYTELKARLTPLFTA